MRYLVAVAAVLACSTKKEPSQQVGLSTDLGATADAPLLEAADTLMIG